MTGNTTPNSILIIGAGVFGLSSAWALAKRKAFAKTSIVVVDDFGGAFPASDAASVDSSRIIRADYANPAYAKLAAEAQVEWRKTGDNDLGGQGRYTQSGLVVSANEVAEERNDSKKGMDYAKSSCENVMRLGAEETSSGQEGVSIFESRRQLQQAFSLNGAGNPGDWGYINRGSGWADAEEGMKWLHRQVQATGRVTIVDSKVKQLATEGKRVIGAEMVDGSTMRADIVFVATGAWTAGLVDLRGRVEATGHIMAYMNLSNEEAERLKKHPIILNLTSGLFCIPPRSNVLKLARHGFGYHNPTRITTALPLKPSDKRGEPIVASLPWTSRDGSAAQLPAEAEREMRRALHDLLPSMGLERRAFAASRICWYSDTVDGDWLVDWHPGWEGLFVACGDSGHAYKFLPVLGEKLVDCMEGRGGELGHMWRWKEVADERLGRVVDGVYKGLTTNDGSRGGKSGMILREELEKGSLKGRL